MPTDEFRRALQKGRGADADTKLSFVYPLASSNYFSFTPSASSGDTHTLDATSGLVTRMFKGTVSGVLYQGIVFDVGEVGQWDNGVDDPVPLRVFINPEMLTGIVADSLPNGA